MNQKGTLFDSMTIIVQMALFALIALTFTYAYSVANQSVQASTMPTIAKDVIGNAASTLPSLFDFGFILFFIGLPLISAVLAYFNNVHPFFFWLSLAFSMILVMVGKAMQIAWEAALSDPALNSVAQSMPMMNFVLSDYGFYSFFVVVIIALGTFVKLRGGISRDIYGGIS